MQSDSQSVTECTEGRILVAFYIGPHSVRTRPYILSANEQHGLSWHNRLSNMAELNRVHRFTQPFFAADTPAIAWSTPAWAVRLCLSMKLGLLAMSMLADSDSHAC